MNEALRVPYGAFLSPSSSFAIDNCHYDVTHATVSCSCCKDRSKPLHIPKYRKSTMAAKSVAKTMTFVVNFHVKLFKNV